MNLLFKLMMKGGGASLPQAANLVYRMSADSLVLADNALVSTWADTVGANSATAAGGARPTFKTGQLGGKPCVRFDGSANTMNVGRPAALVSAIDSQVYTVIVVCKVNGAAGGGFGGVFSSWNGGGLLMTADGTQVGPFDLPRNPFPTSTMCISGFTSQGVPAWNASVSGLIRSYINGGCVMVEGIKGSQASANNFTLGSNPSPGQYFNGDLFEVLVWNTALTPTEMFQATARLCDKYGQAYPWAAAPYIAVHDGDSITAGLYLTDSTHNFPYQAAQSRSAPYGTWTNVALAGQKMTEMLTKSAEFTGIAAATGKPVKITSHEYHNEAGTAPATLQAATATYCAAMRAIPNTKLVFGTTTSSSSDPAANRTTHNAYVIANSATLCDARVDLHLNASIGISGAAATDNNVTYFIDQLHMKSAGHAIQASLFNTGLAAA